MKDLEAENRALHRRLKVLMRWAEENEERMRRFQAQELRLLGINSLYELLLMLVHETRVKFKLEVITLVLLDGDHEIRHLLQHLFDCTFYIFCRQLRLPSGKFFDQFGFSHPVPSIIKPNTVT